MADGQRRPELSRPISGLGPHGEFPAPADQLHISDDAAVRASAQRFSIVLVLHQVDSDWSALQVAGIRATLDRCGADLADVIDCRFQPDRQSAAMYSLARSRPDAVIGIPIDRRKASEAFRAVARAGITLVLMDNVPAGMVARKDYVSVVSSDNFGNGEVAAEILAEHIPTDGTVAIIGYGLDFPVTNERELGFRRWMREHRPAVRIERRAFDYAANAGKVVEGLLSERTEVDGMFVVWADPAVVATKALVQAGANIPITTVDLSADVGMGIAGGGLIKGAGAQLPYDQGVAEATVALMALAGDEPPPWVALPAFKVTRDNIVDAYEIVWHDWAPGGLHDAIEAAASND
jgi:ribose transport system substrate-binding protein